MVKKLIYIANARLPTEKAHGHQIVRMCEAFAAHGLDVVLLHPRRGQVNPMLNGKTVFDYYGVKHSFTIKTLPNWDVVRLEGVVPKGIFPGFFFTHAFIWGFFASLVARKQRGDIYFTREPLAAWFLTRMGLPTVFEAHTIPNRISQRVMRRLERSSFLRRIVAVTEHLKKDLCSLGIPGNKITVLHDGVDLERFGIDIGKEQARSVLGLPQDRPLVVYTGHLFTDKGVDTLAKAACLLEDMQVFLVGGMREDVDRMERLLDDISAKNVTLLGHMPPDNIPLVLKAADLLALPMSARRTQTAYYTSPMKLFEYMASGRPIVASDLPSVREVLVHGESAWLVEPDNPQALADGLYYMLRNEPLAKKFADSARQEVEKYTWRRRVIAILKGSGCDQKD